MKSSWILNRHSTLKGLEIDALQMVSYSLRTFFFLQGKNFRKFLSHIHQFTCELIAEFDKVLGKLNTH